MLLKVFADFIWKRHQGHWNWILMVCTLVVFLLAVWTHSVLLSIAVVAGAAVSMMELPAPEPPFACVERIIDHERKWLASPSGWKKRLQGFGMAATVVYVFWSCWAGSLMALLLIVGLYANIACVYGNKAMGIDDL